MYIDKEYCFDPLTQEECIRKPRPIPVGRTVFYGIQPRYMNVDIKIILNVLQGDVDMYLATRDNLFVVQTNQSNGFHQTFLDKTFIQSQFINASSHQALNSNSSNDEEEHFWWLSVDDGMLANHAHTIQPPYYLREQHLANSLPQYYTMDSLHEIAIFRKVRNRFEVTIPYRSHELRTTRFYIVLRGNSLISMDGQEIENLGFILFRQDQCRIDLFVFFSVFFSSFFLFLCLLVLAWKIKQMMDNRRAQHMHEIELVLMASRPFSSVNIYIKDSRDVEPMAGFRRVHELNSPVQATPAKKMSLFRQLTFGLYIQCVLLSNLTHLNFQASRKAQRFILNVFPRQRSSTRKHRRVAP